MLLIAIVKKKHFLSTSVIYLNLCFSQCSEINHEVQQLFFSSVAKLSDFFVLLDSQNMHARLYVVLLVAFLTLKFVYLRMKFYVLLKQWVKHLFSCYHTFYIFFCHNLYQNIYQKCGKLILSVHQF